MVAALAGLAWAVLALAYASLAPANYVPRVFQSFHVEHFAAFYVVTLLAAAALPGAELRWLGFVAGLLATAFAVVRFTFLVHRAFYAEDLACDVAGIFSALAPMTVQRLREREIADPP